MLKFLSLLILVILGWCQNRKIKFGDLPYQAMQKEVQSEMENALYLPSTGIYSAEDLALQYYGHKVFLPIILRANIHMPVPSNTKYPKNSTIILPSSLLCVLFFSSDCFPVMQSLLRESCDTIHTCLVFNSDEVARTISWMASDYYRGLLQPFEIVIENKSTANLTDCTFGLGAQFDDFPPRRIDVNSTGKILTTGYEEGFRFGRFYCKISNSNKYLQVMWRFGNPRFLIPYQVGFATDDERNLMSWTDGNENWDLWTISTVNKSSYFDFEKHASFFINGTSGAGFEIRDKINDGVNFNREGKYYIQKVTLSCRLRINETDDIQCSLYDGTKFTFAEIGDDSYVIYAEGKALKYDQNKGAYFGPLNVADPSYYWIISPNTPINNNYIIYSYAARNLCFEFNAFLGGGLVTTCLSTANLNQNFIFELTE